ncbi:hypothetical protein F4818DRAFT_139362 [Hypoxylon cercidicola]|nr:hypothetical protein F4818DRAFT_139362 [Hypoxylon cercidicola]
MIQMNSSRYVPSHSSNLHPFAFLCRAPIPPPSRMLLSEVMRNYINQTFASRSLWVFSRYHHESFQYRIQRLHTVSFGASQEDADPRKMLHISTSVPPSCPRSISKSFTDRGEMGRFDMFELNSPARSIDVPKKVSFPEPPRPPTPGPPPRPPPIPPCPPVPTPPPSPRSEAEAAWLRGLVAKQLSILAVQLLNIWFAPRALVSLPYPDRPPTPGPRSVLVVLYYP